MLKRARDIFHRSLTTYYFTTQVIILLQSDVAVTPTGLIQRNSSTLKNIEIMECLILQEIYIYLRVLHFTHN